MKRLHVLFLFTPLTFLGQTNVSTSINVALHTTKLTPGDTIQVKMEKVSGNVHYLYCINGFGGGNVAASIGDDGILLVDNMYAKMSQQILQTLSAASAKPVRIIVNSHFHRDHIEGNSMFRDKSLIIAHENVAKRLIKNNKETAPTAALIPTITFHDTMSIRFNGEQVKLIHFPNSHTDGDVAVYFTGSKTLHLGDMFFSGMFPAVYAEGGGNIRGLILSLEKIMEIIPADAMVIPGHGEIATMKGLASYIAMLRETVAIVDQCIKEGKTLEQATAQKVLAKYDALGQGGAQTTDQYLKMLYTLLSIR